MPPRPLLCPSTAVQATASPPSLSLSDLLAVAASTHLAAVTVATVFTVVDPKSAPFTISDCNEPRPEKNQIDEEKKNQKTEKEEKAARDEKKKSRPKMRD
jgi:hypothetical protein